MSDCIDHGFTGDKQGYTRVKYNGRTELRHRVVYAEYNEIPISNMLGFVVRHICDNPRCINPHHLLLGTHAQNTADMLERGRGPTGEKGGNSKLTWEIVAAIRSRYTPRCHINGCRALAREYGVAHPQVSAVIHNRQWRELLIY